ncbi:hypothetical protein V498_07380, partial [Pseudogymnoascus sp. VKM F-4517 (FW-2822)]
MFAHSNKNNAAQEGYELAQQYLHQHKYSEAETLFQKSAQEFEKVLGAEHRRTLESKFWLAQSVYKQNQYAKAETLFQKSVQEREKVLDAVDRGTADSRFWLALTVYNQHQYAKAETLFQKSAQEFEKVLGAEHMGTLDSKFWLAVTVYNQHQYAKAETLFQKSVQEREKVLGAEHNDTLNSKFFLERAVSKKNQYTETRQPLPELVQKREKVLSIEHEDTPKTKPLASGLSAISQLSIQPPAETVANRLGEYFGADKCGRAQYTDFDIARISLLLKQANPEWSKVPRIYIILRTIGCLSHLDTFIDLGFSDYWLPFTERSLPHCVRPSQRSQFVATQNIAMTQSLDLEKGAAGQHCNFDQKEVLPLEEKGIIGSGGYGQVDKVLSLVSFKEYARKRVTRHMAFGRRTEDLQSFIAEIEILKRLNHHHIVEFVGSYTDPRFMGLIMSPVADMDLSTYLEGVDTSRHMELRTFFGCLARALEFLHEQKVR